MTLFFAKSKSLPGVAIMMCGLLLGFLKSAIFYSRGTPPKKAPHLNSGFLKYLPNLLKSLKI
jgi:hypothetical protein